ncbi:MULTISPECIES: phosphoribosylglycinamide formyltransferase [unclassified Bacillus (in: firmicutes)]|uniref:phosphoribosylglycinamide formyltransferase n=1 Tax=unclassified Bacillus (in: firmicutes) TaxID=185979 RepID=UPI001BEB7F5B|nr:MULTISPECIES: phosphoribosylglycinamide formyltransferase [unclassified Bacillus (in: firmicutes)]MBT2638676.1 phosphoribosylglycinamide formyltransferase [Bacillus sp. ISL-39]MBT2663001.1 phosphoribosylglycinamide formyltransferase [Bacillus sp. ISL-45]
MKKIAVFASGSGSNFQAIAVAAQAGTLKADISLLVCDKPGAFAIDRAEMLGIPAFVISPKSYPSKAAYEAEILQKLAGLEIEMIVLAGYMRLIGPTLLEAYEGKIVNIHPSLLPAFPGKDAIGQALAAGVEKTGVTIHYVDEGMDTGPAIASATVKIAPGETRETLQKKIQRIEHSLFPEVLEQLLNGEGEAVQWEKSVH